MKSGPGGEIAIPLVQQAQDLADGVIVLIQAKMAGPALVLARPMVESYARAMWAKDASADEVEGFRKGRRKQWDKLIEELESRAPEEAPWIRATMEANREDFHDLTHGGYLHVTGRRQTPGTIEPRYPTQWLEGLLDNVMEIYIRCGLALFEWMGDANACAELNAWLTRKGVRPSTNATDR